MGMKRVSVRLALSAAVVSGVIAGVTLPGEAQEKAANLPKRDRAASLKENRPATKLLKPMQLDRVERPATTVKEWMAQMEADLVRVTGVRINQAEQGLQVILETASGQTLAATQQTEGNTLVLTVPNAVLALSDGQAFEAEKPVEGVDRVAVTQANATTIRVSITGLNDLPTAEVVPGQGLVLTVTPEEGIEEEITVTGKGGCN